MYRLNIWPMQVQVNLSPDSYLYRMNDVSRELYIVAGGAVELLIEQDDQLDFVESSRSAGQVCCACHDCLGYNLARCNLLQLLQQSVSDLHMMIMTWNERSLAHEQVAICRSLAGQAGMNGPTCTSGAAMMLILLVAHVMIACNAACQNCMHHMSRLYAVQCEIRHFACHLCF